MLILLHQVRETVSLHCGFFNENGGFRISDKDKRFMQTCEVVVSTCAFGGGDNLYEPIGMSKASSQKVGHSVYPLSTALNCFSCISSTDFD